MRGVNDVIIVDESKLRYGTLAQIGEDYGMKYDYADYEVETYEAFIQSIVDRLEFNVDDFKERILNIVKNNLKIELKLVDDKEG